MTIYFMKYILSKSIILEIEENDLIIFTKYDTKNN